MKRTAIVKGDPEDVMVEVVAELLVEALARGVDPGVCVAENTQEALAYVRKGGDGGRIIYRSQRSAEARLTALRNLGIEIVVARVDEQKIHSVEDIRT